jgi:secreted trypsin-like serine protease
MQEEDLKLSPERQKTLFNELRRRGFYYPGNVFNDIQSVEKSENTKFELKITIVTLKDAYTNNILRR